MVDRAPGEAREVPLLPSGLLLFATSVSVLQLFEYLYKDDTTKTLFFNTSAKLGW
jgi:hypothetical protein